MAKLDGVLALALQWREARAKRQAAQKEVDLLEEGEKILKKQVMDALRASPNKAVSNGARLFQLVPGFEPVAEDWTKVYEHIQKTGEFELLHRRLSSEAVKERWTQNIAIPGVGKIPVETLSDTKAKG
jgi:hypothetical protein